MIMLAHHRAVYGTSLVAAVVLGVSGCGTASGGGSSEARSSTTAKYSTVAAGKLTIITEYPYPPFEYNDKSGKLTGFEVDLIGAAAKILHLRPVWKNTSNYGQIFTTVSAGNADIAVGGAYGYAAKGSSSASKIASRSKIVDFGIPYYSVEKSVLVNTHTVPASVTSISGLTPKDTCGIEPGSASASWSTDHLGPQGVKFTQYQSSASMFDALVAGRLDCVAFDAAATAQLIKTNPKLVRSIQTIASGEEVTFAYAKDNKALGKAVNGAIKKTFKNGVYKKIYRKYFPTQALPTYAR